jgi:phosphate transport system substrate-binding protein
MTLDGSAEFSPLIQQLTADYTSQCPNSNATPFTIGTDGSKASLDAVASGKVNLAYSDRMSITRPGLVDYRVAALAYSVMVSSDTNVTNLTTAQLQGIYTGKITDWSQVGGSNEPIVIVSRAPGSTIRSIFESYVLHGVVQSVDGSLLFSDTDDIVARKVLSKVGAISYVSLGAVPSNGAQTVAINGVAPSTSVVADGSYPFWAMEHLYSRNAATGLALSFISYFSTATGANDLAAYGAVYIKNMSLAALNSHSSGPLG